MRKAEEKIVRTLELFRGMSAAHFDLLMRDAMLQRFPAGTELIHEGDFPDYLHIVIDGTVELFSARHQKIATIDIVHPVTTFILAAVIRDEVYLKSARTLVASRILLVPAGAVRAVFSKDAVFARAVVDELALRYRNIVQVLKNDRLRTSAARLVDWIIREDKLQNGKGRFQIPFSKQVLASYLGMRPENLSRALHSLGPYGVSVQGKTLVIRDRALLRKMARSDGQVNKP